MSTVQKRGDKWYAIYKDRAGKWKQKVGYSDKAETVRLARRLEDEEHAVAIGDVDPQAQARRIERAKPASEHVQMFRAHMESKKRHPNHVQYTIKDVERFIEHSGVKTAAAITRPMVDAWRAFCTTTGYPKSAKGETPEPDSPKTANRRVASVRAWLRYLYDNEAVTRVVIDRIEMLHTKGHETKRRRALTAAEVAALIEKCPDENRRELYRFATLTGFRRSECESMTPAAFDFENRTVTVSAIHAKRKTDHQIIPMHSRLIEPLKGLCKGKPADAPLFNVPNRTDVVSTLHADCAAAGVATNDVDFHALRHTFCSLLAAQGIRPEVLMKLARHRDIATTMRYYVHFKPDDERAALERI
jgi:integrase